MPLHVEVGGAQAAPTIVFLHGIGTSGWMWWQQTAALTDFHCLNVDLPGHGKSSDVPWISLANTADQIAEIIDTTATARRAHVVGLSLGGYIGLLLLDRHAAVVEHAVLSGVTAAPMPNRSLLTPQVWMMTLMKQPFFAKRQAKSLGLPPAQQTAFTQNLQAMLVETYRRIMEEAVGFRMSPMLKECAVPTLIAAGGNESDIILQSVEVIPALMPYAQGVLAPGRNHGWNVEAPAPFNAMIRAWVTHAAVASGLSVVQRPNRA
jgi:pimeloyl-ACP methyl ester carboxylesterase